MIEGDEAEMLTATDAPLGETLLIREYLLVDGEAHLPLASSMADPHTEDELVTSSTPKPNQPVPSVGSSSQPTAQANSASVQSLPYARPVTPQLFSRPHTASKALPQQCKSLSSVKLIIILIT